MFVRLYTYLPILAVKSHIRYGLQSTHRLDTGILQYAYPVKGNL